MSKNKIEIGDNISFLLFMAMIFGLIAYQMYLEENRDTTNTIKIEKTDESKKMD